MLYSHNSLDRNQQARIRQLWPDGLNPADFVYSLDGRGEMVGRQAISFTGKKDLAAGFGQQEEYGLPPALPKPVRSAMQPPKKLTLKQIQKELAWPGPRPKRRSLLNDLGHLFISSLATLIYLNQRS